MGSTVQILLELLIAAAFGGAIGWGVHILYLKRMAAQPETVIAADPTLGPEAQARIAELEDKLAKISAVNEDLHRKSGIPRAGEENAPVPEGSLAWRNRHLESRVRFLEGKLADVESEVDPQRISEDQNDEATRLRWRSRYLEGRVKYLEEELVRTGGFTTTITATPPGAADARMRPPEGDKPELIESPRGGQGDDLKLISGIGPKLEQKLNSLGVWHYEQVASWNQREIDWVNAAISFRGRIERERWISQAAALLQGATPAPATEDNPTA